MQIAQKKMLDKFSVVWYNGEFGTSAEGTPAHAPIKQKRAINRSFLLLQVL